jgi:hypothetical protein
VLGLGHSSRPETKRIFLDATERLAPPCAQKVAKGRFLPPKPPPGRGVDGSLIDVTVLAGIALAAASRVLPMETEVNDGGDHRGNER